MGARSSSFTFLGAMLALGLGCGGTTTGGEGSPDAGSTDAPPAPKDGPQKLATSDNEVVWVGVVADSVYFSIYTEAIDGEPSAGGAKASVVAKASAPGGLYVTNGVAFDSTYVYWSEGSGGGTDGTISRAPLTGGSPQSIASTSGFVAGVALDFSGNVYWVEQDQGKISRAPVAGGSATVVASGLKTPAGISIHAGTLYLTDADGDVLSAPAAGGAVTTLVHGPGLPPHTIVADLPANLAVDDDNVYFSPCFAPQPTVSKVPRAGGAATVLAPGCAGGIAIDAKNVYWVAGSSGTTINEVPIAGGAVKVLASNQSNPVGPALDENSVYWGTGANVGTCGLCPPGPMGSNSVMKAAK